MSVVEEIADVAYWYSKLVAINPKRPPMASTELTKVEVRINPPRSGAKALYLGINAPKSLIFITQRL